MTIEALFKDKSLRPKERTETLSQWILDRSLPIDELLAFAISQKDPVIATCIESLEYATKQHPGLAGESVLTFVTESLLSKAPRIKWESARVIGNIAGMFPENLQQPISNLLLNTGDEGTVVRWSAAFALGEILKLKTREFPQLMIEMERIAGIEEKNSIKKIYLAAIKKVKSTR